MVGVSHDELSEGGTLDGVVYASVVVDVEGLGQDAGPDVHRIAIFRVLESFSQS